MTFDGESVRRELPFDSADCGELAQTVAILVRALAPSSWPPPALAAPAAPDRESGDVIDPPNPDRVPPRARPQRTLLAGGFIGAGAGNSGWSIMAAAESPFDGPRAVGLMVGYDGSVNRPMAAGAVSASRWTVGALARHAVELGRETHLDILGGPSVCLIHASAHGYRVDASAVAMDVAATAMLRLRRQLFAGVAGTAALAASASAHRTAIDVQWEGRVVVLPPLRFSLLVGASWDAD